jgi:hypothetical protein
MGQHNCNKALQYQVPRENSGSQVVTCIQIGIKTLTKPTAIVLLLHENAIKDLNPPPGGNTMVYKLLAET